MMNQLQLCQRELEKKKKTAFSLTLFNDGIFGSETDLGTYGTEPRIDNSSNNRAWARQDELDWQETQMQRSFTGGEAVGMPDVINEVSPRSTANSLDSSLMIRELDQMHVSYLNSTYRQEQLNAWKNQSMTWNGETISVYDYIGRHLGYRFTVTQVKISCVSPEKKKQTQSDTQSQISENVITLTIKNTGFANMCEEAVSRLILTENNENIKAFEIKSDPCTWNSGTDTVIEHYQPIF